MLILNILCGLLLSNCVSAASSVAATFNNGIQFQFDTDGNAIDSTSGKIDFLNGEYVGELANPHPNFLHFRELGRNQALESCD